MSDFTLSLISSNKPAETLHIYSSEIADIPELILHPLRMTPSGVSGENDDISHKFLIREINNSFSKSADLSWYNKEEVITIINNPLITTGRELYRLLREHDVFYFDEIMDSNNGIHKLTVPKTEFIAAEFFGITDRTLTRGQFKLDHQKILFSEKGIELIRKIL